MNLRVTASKALSDQTDHYRPFCCLAQSNVNYLWQKRGYVPSRVWPFVFKAVYPSQGRFPGHCCGPAVDESSFEPGACSTRFCR
jgi:hypothetical protein